MKIRMAVSFILVSLSFVIQGTGELSKGNAYRIISSRDRPGIYYEPVAPMQLLHVDWKVVVFMNLADFLKQTPMIHDKLDRVYDQCHRLTDSQMCREALDRKHLSEVVESARAAERELRSAVNSIKLIAPRDPASRRAINRRSVLLGTAGSLSKSLFGTMDQEDAEYINSQIDRLFNERTNLTELIGKRVHIAASQLQRWHEDHQTEVRQADETFWRLQARRARITNSDALMVYASQMRIYMNQVERAVDKYRRACEHYLRAITLASDGRYDASLLTGSQLQSVHREILSKSSDFEFPVSSTHLRGELIERIVRVDPVFLGDRVIIMMHIPLLDAAKYQLYRAHVWPVPQAINAGLSAYIAPAAPYIAVSADRGRFFLPDQDYIGTCSRIERRYICSTELPMHEVSASEDCEVDMLLRPSTAAFRRCDVRLRTMHRPFWRHLRSQGGWLYSLAERDTVRVLCPGRDEMMVNLEGAGVFHLGADCVGRTRSATLTGMRIDEQSGTERYLIESGVSLNFSALFPEFEEFAAEEDETQEDSRVSGTSGDQSGWTLRRNEKTLTNLKRKVRENKIYKRERIYHERLIVGGSIGYAIMFAIVTWLCCERKFRRHCRGVSRMNRNKVATTGADSIERREAITAAGDPENADVNLLVLHRRPKLLALPLKGYQDK